MLGISDDNKPIVIGIILLYTIYANADAKADTKEERRRADSLAMQLAMEKSTSAMNERMFIMTKASDDGMSYIAVSATLVALLSIMATILAPLADRYIVKTFPIIAQIVNSLYVLSEH